MQKHKRAAGYDEQISLKPTTDVIWPGAIIDGATIFSGDYVPITLPRAPMTISISLENITGEVYRQVNDPAIHAVRQAVRDILDQQVTGSTPADMSFEIVDIHSEDQLAIALGLTYKNGLSQVSGQFDFNNHKVVTRKLVKFMQVYYSLDVTPPRIPSAFFSPSITLKDVKDAISEDTVPMYVASIKYGRMVIYTVESNLNEV
ncbi:MAG: hypothetical protein GY869_07360, partial [Planctomycetes bacterium]|nr:hypothetical protein [Planctomycetota bacterium]